MRDEFARKRGGRGWALVVFGLFAGAVLEANVQAQEPVAPRTTLIVYAKQKMREEQWTALFVALQAAMRGTEAQGAGIPMDTQILRGDAVAPGLVVENSIAVYLEGDCNLIARPKTTPRGALGWVMRVHGRIEPFIHVNCGELVDMLGPAALGMNEALRAEVMGEAMARVVMHEWIHVASQNPGHRGEGVTKSAFDVRDLLAGDADFNGKGEKRRKKLGACCVIAGDD